MGKAAARLGDTANTCNDPSDMPVGKVIAVGTVLINKMPAAKQNDQIVGVDTHIIMIPSPGGPIPTPLPHPFVGMIDSGCSTSVNIMGMAAATVDSQASAMPPHIPQGGPFQKPPSNKAKIIIGSPDVFIGNGGGGGGGGSGGGASATTQTESQEVEAGHFLDVKFVDKGGKPIMGIDYEIKTPDNKRMQGPLTGQIRKAGVAEGDYEITLRAITRCAWSENAGRDGDKVKMQVETAGIEDGATAVFHIWQRDIKRADQEIGCIDNVKLKGGKVEAEWQYEYHDNYDATPESRQERGYSCPSFYFTIKIENCRERSPLLKYADYIEMTINDNQGNALADEEYVVNLPDGEIRKGKLDSHGYAKIENVPPGQWDVRFPNRDIIREED
jgi:uncharacterized Zn-binding protein involved in type VI secretion